MARIARIVLPGKPHLVSQSGAKPLFSTAKRRQKYLEILRHAAAMYQVKVLAWAVAPSQVAMVVVPPNAQAFAGFMRVAQTRYARHLRASGFGGEVTPRRFSSCPLDDAAARDAIKMVESLPVELGLSHEAAAYPFSSAAARTVGDEILLASVPQLTGQIGDWDKWLADRLPPERVGYLQLRLRTGKPAGQNEFVRRIERKIGRNLSRPRGRPRKS